MGGLIAPILLLCVDMAAAFFGTGFALYKLNLHILNMAIVMSEALVH